VQVMAELVLGDEAGHPERTFSLPPLEMPADAAGNVNTNVNTNVNINVNRDVDTDESVAEELITEENQEMNAAQMRAAQASPTALFAKVAQRVAADPTLVRRVNAVYQFNVHGDDGGTWVVDLKNGAGEVWSGVHESADCIISINQDDFLALASGRINPLNAFMQGRIRVQGDIMMATRLQSLF